MTATSSLAADWVDPAAMLCDPYPTYRRLRSESPVAWVPSLNRYLVTSFQACRTIEEDQDTFSANVTGGAALMARALGARPMLRKDDPEHAVERRAINPTLRPKTLRATWVPRFERTARTYLAVLRERGPDDADLNRDYAGPVAAQNLIDLLGLTGAAVHTTMSRPSKPCALRARTSAGPAREARRRSHRASRRRASAGASKSGVG